MIFSRKKIEKDIRQALDAAAIEVEKAQAGLRESIEKAQMMTDPGERYLALLDIEEKIAGFRDFFSAKTEAEKNRRLASAGSYVNKGLGMIAVGMASTFGAILVATNPLFWIPGGVLWLGGLAPIVWGAKTAEKYAPLFADFKKKAETAVEKFLEETSQRKSDILKNDLPGIAVSKHFDALYDRVPAIKEAFLKATARDSVKAAAPQPPARLSGGSRLQL